MSEAEFKIPRKFTFDEYYEMLKEFVNDPEAHRLLATYDEEVAAGRVNLYMTDSAVYTEVLSDLRGIGWRILVSRGWPTYIDIIRNEEAFGEWGVWAVPMGDALASDAMQIMHGDWPQMMPGAKFDIEDKASVLKLLKFKASIDQLKNSRPYDLGDL